MIVTATEFKAKCLSLIDRVHRNRETITITKRGKVVAKLTAEHGLGEKRWMKLRGQVTRYDDHFAPAVGPDDVDALC